MPQYGNSNGRNRGKKYHKLTGDEIATPENEVEARKFLNWYGAIYKYLCVGISALDLEVANDTMIKITNDILYKSVRIGNYRGYYLRAYHTTRLATKIKEDKRVGMMCELTGRVEQIPDAEFDFGEYELRTESFIVEMTEYVRANYTPREVSLFEIYTGLLPDASYSDLSEMLGISASLIYNAISAIKRDLRIKYAEKYNYLLSSS